MYSKHHFTKQKEQNLFWLLLLNTGFSLSRVEDSLLFCWHNLDVTV